MLPLIDKQESLLEVCESLAHADCVALDTEFVRERTYYPQLCLLQLAFDERLVLIDPLAGLDLAPLFECLQRPGLVKILHAARQDFEIFYLLGGFVPAPVFDTQLAAACLGLGDQLSYTRLVAMELGADLGKSHARTNWSRRPLSAAQLRYAADDVEYLLQLYPVLRDRLRARHRERWLDDAFRQLADPHLYEVRPAEAWRRVRAARRLKGSKLTRLRRLAAWREELAMERDLPRRWVLSDDALLALASHDGSDPDALRQIPGVPEKLLRAHGETLCGLLKRAETEETGAPTSDNAGRSGRDQRELKRLAELVKSEAQKIGTSPALLATRSDLKSFLAQPGDSALLQGWRKEVIGEKLLGALEAEGG